MSTQLRSGKRQAGAIAMILAIVAVALVALLLSNIFLRGTAKLDQDRRTTENLQRVSDALVVYASLNQRLPCPANGTAPLGDEVWIGTSANCTEPAGTVPWRALALRREDSLDGWGRKISYRVFATANGFTRTGGLNLTNCNSNAALIPTLAPIADCNSTPPRTHRDDFLRDKGLSLNELGMLKSNQFAFVLISHGESGQGAFGAEATRRNELPAAGGKELDNASESPIYWILARSDRSIALADLNHFDDVVRYMTINDLVVAAKLDARDWGAP